MKLISAHIKNFRLLKDLKLDFSSSDEKKLTVIRAANETGKTTCEYALMWGLYGSKVALPSRGAYTLFPADEKEKGTRAVDVSVEVEFELDVIAGSLRGAESAATQRYRAIRSCREKLTESGSEERELEQLWVYRVTGSGTEPLDDFQAKQIVQDALPSSLKDVYFTDGDRAMSFIEAAAAQGVKRKRVSDAIESLLGLEILDKTNTHLGNVLRKFSSEIDDTNYAEELEKLHDRISSAEEDLDEWQQDLDEKEEEISSANESLRICRRKIDETLQLGDKEALLQQKKQFETSHNNLLAAQAGTLKGFLKLASGESVSVALLKGHLVKALDPLQKMKEQKMLPKVNLPILEELLEREDCFCGADLSTSTDAGKNSRARISEAIDKSRASDAIQEVVTALFYRSRSLKVETAAEDFKEVYHQLFGALQHNQSALSRLEDNLEGIEKKIDEINDSQLVELRTLEESLKNKLASAQQERGTLSGWMTETRNRKTDYERDLAVLEKRAGKSDSGTARLEVTRIVKTVFEGIVEQLKHKELVKVSDEMNRIFLGMIGSDPEQNALTLITKAELTEDFDIRVYGPRYHELNPDQDLNGASRRAITLAFILALTKVSQVEAPNVIDTPLGMTSGYVKQSILLQTLKEGSQVVLFLTHDEIKGVESIIDQYAGSVYTLTNPAHYPKMLTNEPQVSDARIIRCECSHRQTCNICDRQDVRLS